MLFMESYNSRKMNSCQPNNNLLQSKDEYHINEHTHIVHTVVDYIVYTGIMLNLIHIL